MRLHSNKRDNLGEHTYWYIAVHISEFNWLDFFYLKLKTQFKVFTGHIQWKDYMMFKTQKEYNKIYHATISWHTKSIADSLQVESS